MAAILGFPGLGAYGAAKAGVTELTRVAAIELAHQLIRVNCILPGGIVTPNCCKATYITPTTAAMMTMAMTMSPMPQLPPP